MPSFSIDRFQQILIHRNSQQRLAITSLHVGIL